MIDTSAMLPGEERFQNFKSFVVRRQLVEYFYRDMDGVLFSTISISMEDARMKKNIWIAERSAKG